eukprot:5794381-Pleurochrysis_carterae.AAC.1
MSIPMNIIREHNTLYQQLKDLFQLLHSSSPPANRRATVVESDRPSLTNESCARMIQKMRADG